MKVLITMIYIMSSVSQASEMSFNEVMIKYESLHQAFFENDNSKVKKAANDVLKKIEKVNNKKIVKVLSNTKTKISEMSSNDNFNENKKSFNIISQDLLVVLEKHSKNKKYARYYCPMVKKYWIQNISKSEEVMNPYASESMPHCGAKK